MTKSQSLKLLIGASLLLAVVLAMSVFFVPKQALAASSTGLVPCGTTANPKPCTFCDLFQLASNVQNFFLVDIMTPVAVLFVVIAGFMMLIYGAQPKLYDRGKKILTNTLTGIAIILLAWLLVNTVLHFLAGNNNLANSWYKIQCTVQGPVLGGGGTPGGGTTPPGGGQKYSCNSQNQCVVDANGQYAESTCGGNCQTTSGGGGQPLTCNVSGLLKNPGACSDAGQCPDCKPLTISANKSNLQAAASLADFLNNQFGPALQAAGIKANISEAMCPTGAHASCAHFNGHAVDFSYNTGNLASNLQQACQILNSLGLQGKSSETSADRGVYVLEVTSPGGACPSVCGRASHACGASAIHLQY